MLKLRKTLPKRCYISYDIEQKLSKLNDSNEKNIKDIEYLIDRVADQDKINKANKQQLSFLAEGAKVLYEVEEDVKDHSERLDRLELEIKKLKSQTNVILEPKYSFLRAVIVSISLSILISFILTSF